MRTSDEAAVLSAHQQQIDCLKAEDGPGLVALYDDQAAHLPHGFPVVVGREELDRMGATLFDERSVRIDSEEVDQIEVSGDLAVMRTGYEATFLPKNGSEPVREHGWWLQVFRRQADGVWKVFQNTWAPIKQPQMR